MRRLTLLMALFGLFQFGNSFSKGDYSIEVTSKNSVSYGLKHSDIIFLGELLHSDASNFTYSFRILELYKGKIKSDTINGIGAEEGLIFPVDYGLWIVYAKYNKDSTTISVNQNGSTMPMKWAHYFGPPPPPKFYSKDFKSDKILDARIDKLEGYNKGLRDWFYDLERLRKYRDSNKVIVQQKSFDYKLVFLVVSFAINIFLFMIVLVKLKNK